MESLRCEGFRGRAGFFIPPGSDSNPFFIALAGHADGVELATSMPRVLATDGRLDAAMAALVQRLSEPTI